MSAGSFSTLTVGNNINFFNADGSYFLRGPGNVGRIKAAEIISNRYLISSNSQLGIQEGGIGYLQGLNISQPITYTSINDTNGNLTFTGNYLKQGIVFADNSFLNSANKFNNITTSDINSNTGLFNSLNITGNLINNNNTVLTNLSCNGSADFKNINLQNISGDYGIFSSLTINGNNTYSLNSNSANILNIYGNTISYNNASIPNITNNTITSNNMSALSGNISYINSNGINVTGESIFTNTTSNNINTTTLKFVDGSIQKTAPGMIIKAVISQNWNPTINTVNSPLELPIGTWLINFNIYFPNTNSNIAGSNYIRSTANNTYFPITTLEFTSDTKLASATCSGTFIYIVTESKIIDLVTLIPSFIDVDKSYHVAVRIA